MNLFNYDKPKRKWKCCICFTVDEEDINNYLLEDIDLVDTDYEDIDEEDIPTIDDLDEEAIHDIVEEIAFARINEDASYLLEIKES